MLFNSYIFIFFFLPIALIGWYGLNYLKKYRWAQGFLIVMSLWFYSYFNLSYLFVIIASCVVNYLFSMILAKKDTAVFRKAILVLGCVVNLGILGIFKYYDFFVENLNQILGSDFSLKHILLPLGISFFTFQQLSFVIDRCKGNAPHYSLLDYLNFVTFFPQLIAGPIVLHSEIIPQFQEVENRRFSIQKFAYGICFFVYGLAKKVLLADTLAKAVNYGFSGIAKLDTPAAVMVALSFTLELYFDFSGYCDMAVGIGKMFGIEIPDNFNAPYQSASVKEFWRRWHMTLGRFFTQYVYIPLGGSKKGRIRTVINTMIVFLLSGLWHGANWTFVFWGFLHGVGVSVNSVYASFRQRKVVKKAQTGDLSVPMIGRVFRRLRKVVCQIITFMFICLTFVFFRSNSMADAWLFMKRLCSGDSYYYIMYITDEIDFSELYVVTKIVSMKAAHLLRYVNYWAYLLVLGISALLILGKTTRQRLENKTLTVALSWKLTILFVWSVISLTGVSTFLYFNF